MSYVCVTLAATKLTFAPMGTNPVSLPGCNCCPNEVVAVLPTAQIILAVLVSQFIRMKPMAFVGAVRIITVDTVAAAAEPDPVTGGTIATALVVPLVVWSMPTFPIKFVPAGNASLMFAKREPSASI